jgi:UTP--glucose-1-phosphate uridylyltransferase
MAKHIRKAVFPVAGLSTRLLPASKTLPTEMMPIIDKPAMQYALEEARAAGIEEFIFVTGRGGAAVENHLDVTYELGNVQVERGEAGVFEAIRQRVPAPGRPSPMPRQDPLDLGHAVWCARNMIGDEPFAVLLADELIVAEKPCLQQMMEAFATVQGQMVAAMEVPHSQETRDGVLRPAAIRGRLVEANDLAEDPVLAPAPPTIAVVGRYLLQPEIFDSLERLASGNGKETRLAQAILRSTDRHPLHGYLFAGQRFDCSDKLGFLEAHIALALARSDVAPAVERMIERYGAVARKRGMSSSRFAEKAAASGDRPIKVEGRAMRR